MDCPTAEGGVPIRFYCQIPRLRSRCQVWIGSSISTSVDEDPCCPNLIWKPLAKRNRRAMGRKSSRRDSRSHYRRERTPSETAAHRLRKLLSSGSNASWAEQRDSGCPSPGSGSRPRDRTAATWWPASSVRPRGVVKRRSAENSLGFTGSRRVSPQLRTFRGGCECRIWIVATTGCEIRTGCHHGLRFGVISGRFGFWRITGGRSLARTDADEQCEFWHRAAWVGAPCRFELKLRAASCRRYDSKTACR